uniref:Rho guanine nucleotide exchange factor 12 n=1 Tax=Junco hyemalis TaxID=40217 RepID=A0A8C5J5M9_JUNHY
FIKFLFFFLFRFPLKKPSRHGSILSRESPADKKQKVERCSSTHDFDPTGLVQRCVVIQRDENGFGLTVSGDNPVFVQSVKEGESSPQTCQDLLEMVNGTLVTHSNHLEVVKLIKSGSYVALTVQGRPPGSPQIPLADSDVDLAAFGHMSPIMASPHSPGTSGNAERITSPVLMGEENNIVHNQKVEILRKMLQKEQERLQDLQEEYSRTPSTRLLKEIQEAKKHIPQLQEQLSKATGCTQVIWAQPALGRAPRHNPGELHFPLSQSPRSGLKERIYPDESPEKAELQDTDSQCSVGSPLSRVGTQIIGAEDDDFDTEQEQINGQCSCFQNIELLKSRPAHLAVLLHHVVSQFDPAALLCYLYTDLYKQTNSKETRRVFLEFYQFFLDRAANLKVPVPEEISLELDRRRPELLPEELHRQFIQTMQDKVCPEVQRNLEDFRQKRSMGLTLAEGELSRLDAERLRDRNAVEKERSCAEQILAKIEEVLMTSQPLEEDKSSTMQYVILTYMKHLGVKVKEPRNLEQKRGRIGFLPKIKQSIKKEKEGEEKGKRRGFPNILGPPRRPSRHDSSASMSPLCPESHRKSLLPHNLDPASLNSLPALSHPEGLWDGILGVKQPGEAPPASESMDGTPRTPNNTFEFPSPLENLQEEEGEAERMVDMGTPKPFRKMDSVGFADVQSEDELYDFDMDTDPPNWQQLVSREVLMGLKPYEIKRQEVINELFYTERAHVRTLKVLHNVFYQRVTREGILSSSDKRKIFSNLEDILGLHVALNDQMKSVRKRNETSVIGQIGEDLLSWFSGAAEEKLKLATATFCSNQPFALEVIKSRQKKDSRFQTFVQDAESNPLCRRLQLKDIIPTEMQRLTKYPLLLDNIAKYTELPEEKEKVKKAADHCRQILNHVNQAVKESENKQHLEDYQRRLDLSYLKQSEDPMMDEFRNLDLTKRKMLHEGPLTWKVNRDKTIDLYTLLLEDILVLLQKQDDKLVLKCHSKILASTADSKHTFSPIIKLNTVLVRQVATDNKAFFVISMSATGAHIYELVAQTVSEKNVWQDLIAQMAGTVKMGSSRRVIPLPQSGPEWNFLQFYHCCFTRIFVFCPPDKDLGLESPLILNPQSSSPIMSEKAKVEGLLEGQFEKGQQAELALKDSSGCSSASVPEGQWARDALRNLGLLKQLLVQQLGLAEKGTLEDRQRLPRFRSASQEAQTESGTEQQQTPNAERQSQQAAEDRALGRTGEEERHGARTAAQCPASGDALRLLGTEPPARAALPMDSTELEGSSSELEGLGADESGEHFFDAREAHGDENPGEGGDPNAIVPAGNYLILDGYGAVQESSTDEEVSALVLQCTSHRPPTPGCPQQQQPLSPREPRRDGDRDRDRDSSPLAEELRWAGLEEPCPFLGSPRLPLQSRVQLLQYIHNIQDALEKLKEVEEDYSVLRRQGLAGSASSGEHSGGTPTFGFKILI